MFNARYSFHRRLQLECRSIGCFKLSIFYCRFAIFRRCLDAEMKDGTRQGVSLQRKKEEKEAHRRGRRKVSVGVQDYLAVDQLSNY